MAAKNRNELTEYLPIKKATGIVQAQVDLEIRAIIKAEIDRLNTTWHDYIEAMFKAHIKKNNLK